MGIHRMGKVQSGHLDRHDSFFSEGIQTYIRTQYYSLSGAVNLLLFFVPIQTISCVILTPLNTQTKSIATNVSIK